MYILYLLYQVKSVNDVKGSALHFDRFALKVQQVLYNLIIQAGGGPKGAQDSEIFCNFEMLGSKAVNPSRASFEWFCI